MARFTRFCVEKNGAKNNVCGEKITLSGMGWVDLWVVGTGGHIWRRRLTPTTALYQTFSFLFTSLRLKIKRFLECILQCISSSVRIVQIEGHGCKLPSMIPHFDRSAQLKITGEANQESIYSKIGRLLCIYLEISLSYLSFYILGVVLSEWCSSQREMSGDGHFWHWQLVSLPGQMLLRGKGDWSKLNDPFIRDSVWCSQ